jgi:phosphatidate cytidylyltransferase
MHIKRIITAIVAFPLLCLLIFKGSGLLFSFFIGIISLVALYEYYRIVFSDNKQAVVSPIVLWGYLCGLLMIAAAHNHSFQLVIGMLVLNFIGAAVLSMPQYKKGPQILDVVEKEIQGMIYIPVSLSLMILLRHGSDGVAWLFFLMFIVFAGDVGAFYSGKFFGRRKLSPSISPGKTIEGSIGGMVFCIIVGYIFMRLFLPHLNRPVIFLLFVVVNISAQTGDLFESQLKRTGNIKDSGNILPGHGGILDRIDALLFATPAAYFFKECVLSGG